MKNFLADNDCMVSILCLNYTCTQKNLFSRDKGVKVELGIPEELWDSTSVEVAQMQRLVKDT